MWTHKINKRVSLIYFHKEKKNFINQYSARGVAMFRGKKNGRAVYQQFPHGSIYIFESSTLPFFFPHFFPYTIKNNGDIVDLSVN